MSTANYNVDESNAQPGRVNVHTQFTAGTSGAVPSTFTIGMGVTSVTKGATGVYTEVLSGYNRVLWAPEPTIIASTRKVAHVTSISVSAGVVTVAYLVCLASDDSASDLASGDIFQGKLELSTLPQP